MPENKHYGIMMHDEMSVRGDLVYDRRNDKIVGFVKGELTPSALYLSDVRFRPLEHIHAIHNLYMRTGNVISDIY